MATHGVNGLKEYLESIDGNNEKFDEIYDEIIQHLNEILSSLEKYFPVSEDISLRQNSCIENQFLIKNKPKEISITEYERFIEMTNDSSLKILFDEMSLTDFWCTSSITNEYPLLAKKTVQILLPFPITYLYETGYSLNASTKIKYRNK